MTQRNQQHRPLTAREVQLLKTVRDAGDNGALIWSLRYRHHFGKTLISRVWQWGYLSMRKEPAPYYGTDLVFTLTPAGAAELEAA